MKKVLALFMCVIMLTAIFAGCTKKDDPGAELDVYLGKTTNFDPAMAYNDQDASQFLSLVYEGLTKIDENGKVVPGMAKWTVKDNVIEFSIKQTRWSDDTSVDSDDFVYAWRRILSPEFECEAASLLFYVENAVAVKNGDTSIYDIGIKAAGKNTLIVTLNDAAFVDEFLYNCSSVALSPLRSDVVSKITVNDEYYGEILKNELTDSSWSTLNAVLVANGPFYVKKVGLISSEPYITLERNRYYLTDPDKEDGEEALQKYVTPYRINVRFVMSDADDKKVASDAAALAKYNNNELIYNGNIDISERSSLKSDAVIKNQLATYSYAVNTTNPLFTDARVRRALSMALDRKAVADLVVFGTAANGLVSPGVFYTDKKTTFRDKAGEVISTTADISGAKALLSQAGVTSGSFELTVRDEPVAKAVAELAKAAWEKLGFTVTIKALGIIDIDYREVIGYNETTGFNVEAVYSDLTRDYYDEAYKGGDFDVIGIDFAMLSADPFSALARYGITYSGGAYDYSKVDESTGEIIYEKVPGMTGYSSAEYDAKIAAALAEKDDGKRAQLLVEAEKMLLTDMPVIPVYFMQSAALVSKNLKNLKYDYYGYTLFTNAKDKTYKYEPVEAVIPVKVRAK